MNKTININLGGIFFHIDEEAYLKLKKYLDAIRKSLSDDPNGKNEILEDIELRIGEILSEKITDIRQVVNLENIDEIISIMGKPEDYSVDEDFFEGETNKAQKSKIKKKLFRDSADKFLGGVSSGLAYYLDVDVIWIRLTWLLLFFGFGFGGLVYLLLWILLPVANTTSEKLEMEGEPVTISNIEKKIKEELTDVSKRMQDGIDGVSKQFKEGNYETKIKSGLQEIIGFIQKILSFFFKTFGKLIGFFLLIIAGLILISLFIGVFSWGSIEMLGFSDEFVSYPDFIYNSRIPKVLLTVFLFLAVEIPFVFFFMLGLRILSKNVKSFTTSTRLSLLGVWLISILALGFAGIENSVNYSNQSTVIVNKDLFKVKQDTIRVKMVATDEFDSKRNFHKVLVDNKEKLYVSNVNLKIRESDSDISYVKIYKRSSGVSTFKAKEEANSILYNFKLEGNAILLDTFFLTEIENKYRNQKVTVSLYIPKGRIIFLDESLYNFLQNTNFAKHRSHNTRFLNYYKMTDSGLKCVSCLDDEVSKKGYVKKDIINNNIEMKQVVEQKDTIISKRVTIDKNGVQVN